MRTLASRSILERVETEGRDLVEMLGRVIDAFPCSRRTLAREAGVSHTTLNRIARGDVGSVELQTARRVAAALERLAEQLGEDAHRVREALPQDGPPSKQEASDG